MENLEVLFKALGGVAIFYFGMKTLSEGLQVSGEELLRKILNSLTTNRLGSFFVGYGLSALTQSVSATIIMTVGFAHAGLMNLSQSVGIVLGGLSAANLTAWLLALGSQKFLWPLAGIGLVAFAFFRGERIRFFGRALISLVFVYLGLEIMTQALIDLESKFLLSRFMGERTLIFLSAVIVSFLFQSHFVVLGLAFVFFEKVAPLSTVLLMVFAGHIGVALLAVVSSRKANVTARRVSLVLFLFTLFSLASLLFFEEKWVSWFEVISAIGGGVAIAATYSLLVFISVVIFLPFLQLSLRLVSALIPTPEKKEPQQLVFFGRMSTFSPALAIEQASQELRKLSAMVQTVLSLTKDHIFLDSDQDSQKRIKKYEEITDNIQKEMKAFVDTILRAKLTKIQVEKVKNILMMTDELEAIADSCLSIHREWDQSPIGDEAEAFKEFVNETVELYDLAFAATSQSFDMDLGAEIERLKELRAKGEKLQTASLQKICPHFFRIHEQSVKVIDMSREFFHMTGVKHA